jgi:hypothetical protein
MSSPLLQFSQMSEQVTKSFRLIVVANVFPVFLVDEFRVHVLLGVLGMWAVLVCSCLIFEKRVQYINLLGGYAGGYIFFVLGNTRIYTSSCLA